MYPDDASRHLRAKILELLENLRRGPIHVLRDATLRLRLEGRKLLAQIPSMTSSFTGKYELLNAR